MRPGSTQGMIRHLRTLYCCGVVGDRSDEHLLEQFIALADDAAEEAFAVLVQRHGPMVYGVCFRLLGDMHEAEDAFQATFLVLARKARAVIKREQVASWLYGVAVRTAKESRVRAARRRAREVQVSKPSHAESPDRLDVEELRSILDEELARLPARDRGPIVLCELEGLSRQEAARRLNIPEGTLSSRLARAKARLRSRLAQRGLAVPLSALSLALVRQASAVTPPDMLIASTTQAAMRVAAGFSAAKVVSASVVSLTEGVLKAMMIAKLKGVAWAVGTVVAVSGAAVLAQAPAGGGPGQSTQSEADRAAAMEKKLDRIISALDRLSGASPTAPGNPTEAAHPEPMPAPANAGLPGRGPLPTSPGAPASLPTVGPQPMPGPQVIVRTPNGSFPQSAGVVAVDPFRPAAVALSRDGQIAVEPKPPLYERVSTLEREVGAIRHRLEVIERRLSEIDKRIGQASIERSVISPTSLYPTTPPSMTPPPAGP